jgi:hypothetical protein
MCCVLAGAQLCLAAPASASEGLGVMGSFGKDVNKTKVEEREKGGAVTEAEEDACTTASGDTCQAGKAGSGLGELSMVPAPESREPGSGVAVNSAGEVYVADTTNNRVEWFSPSGQYEGEFNGSGKLANENGRPAPAALSKPEGIAVDNSCALHKPALTGSACTSSDPSDGDVYVIDASQSVVDKFSATGEYLSQWNGAWDGVAVDPSGDVWVRTEGGGAGSNGIEDAIVQEYSNAVKNVPDPPVSFQADNGNHIAVDSDENLYLTQGTREVVKFSKTGTRLGLVCGGCGRGGLAMDPTNNDLFTDEGSAIEQYGPFGELFVHASESGSVPGGSGNGDNGAGLAVSPVNHDVYVADAESNEVIIFADGATPEPPTTLAAKEVMGDSAVLQGKLRPANGESKVGYYFEYNIGSSCAGGTKTPIKVREGEGEVSEEVTNLEPREEYAYCLVAKGPFGITPGDTEPFSTPAAPPVATNESAYSKTQKFLVFTADVNPNNSEHETTYFFETSTEGSTAANTLSGKIEQVGGFEAIPAEQFGERMVRSYADGISMASETYYYRIVVTSGNGPPVVGKVQTYTKSPIVSGESASTLALTTATVNVEIYPDFQQTKYGVEYATSKTVLEVGDGTKIPAVTELEANEEEEPPRTVHVAVSGLEEDKLYYYRVVAENASTEKAGIPSYGEVKEFTTRSLPFVNTGAATSITSTGATLSGAVTPLFVSAMYDFQYISEAAYRAALARGLADPYEEGEATSVFPLAVSETAQAVGPVLVSGLLPGETYHYRLVSGNAFGVREGESGEDDYTFTTLGASPPLVSTAGVGGVTQTSATLTGTVTTNGLATEYGFEIGTEPNNFGPETGLGSVSGAQSENVSLTLNELQPGTTYYYRVTAGNADGTERGAPESFTTVGLPDLFTVPAVPPLIALPDIVFPAEEAASTRTTTKASTDAQKLAKALDACRKDKKRGKRAKCEARARVNYQSKKKKKKK